MPPDEQRKLKKVKRNVQCRSIPVSVLLQRRMIDGLVQVCWGRALGCAVCDKNLAACPYNADYCIPRSSIDNGLPFRPCQIRDFAQYQLGDFNSFHHAMQLSIEGIMHVNTEQIVSALSLGRLPVAVHT